MLYAGSLVFTPPSREVDLRNWGEWWTFLKGADWRHPYGPFGEGGDIAVKQVRSTSIESTVRLDWRRGVLTRRTGSSGGLRPA
jgi:hypothetical protein